MSGWLKLLPELTLTGLIALVLIVDLIWPKLKRVWLSGLALAGLIVVLALVALSPQGAFGGAFAADVLGQFLKSVILLAMVLVVLLAWDFEALYGRPLAEFLVLLLSAGLGMLMLASSTELVLLYVSLELATFPLVLLTGFRPSDPASAEGGLKYLLLAALGSAVLLFGLSLIYATTGVTQLGLLVNAISASGFGPTLVVGVLCVLAGIGFKLALVPFHMWAPDAYQGATTPITALLSVASKTAGFALALRLLAGGLPAVRLEWAQVLAMLAAASMCLGNFAAIPQTNLKRLMAYSSIAQAGYLLMGLVAFQPLGLAALLYYLAAYLFTNLAAFAVIMAIERATGSTEISALTGLAQRSPRLALTLLLALLSLAGIPPLAGFTAKFYLFAAAFSQGYVWLVVLAVLNSALSLYYYLRVIRIAYILPPEPNAPALPASPWPLAVVLVLTVTGILLLGVLPGPVVEWARAAASVLH